jgi:hypothetical protein
MASLTSAGLRVSTQTTTIEGTTTYLQRDQISDALLSAKTEWIRQQDSTEKPTQQQWFLHLSKLQGMAWATRQSRVLKNYLDHWNDIDVSEDDPIVKKKKIQEDNNTRVAAILGNGNTSYPLKSILEAINRWILSCKYKIPSDIKTSSRVEERSIVISTMALMANVKRPENSNIKQLWISGASGQGKTTITDLIGGHKDRVKELAGDAFGVGRFDTTPDHQILVFDEATVKQACSDQNMRTLNRLADGKRTTIKNHGESKIIEPVWIIVNGNVNLLDFTMQDQTSKEEDKNNPHSYRRRYIELHTTIHPTEEDMDILHSNCALENAGSILIQMAKYYGTKKENYGRYASNLIFAVESIDEQSS